MATNEGAQRLVRIYCCEVGPLDANPETPFVEMLASEQGRVEETLLEAAARQDTSRGNWNIHEFAPFGSVANGAQELNFLSTYSLYIGVRQDGSAIARTEVDDLTWGDLWRAVADEMYPSSVGECLVIYNAGGRGGGHDLWLNAATFLLPQVSAVVTGVITARITKSIESKGDGRFRTKVPRKVLKQARLFAENELPGLHGDGLQQARVWDEQGLNGPRELLEFVYKRGRWTPDHLGKRLRIHPDDAQFLLVNSCGWVKASQGDSLLVPGVLKTVDACLSAWAEAEKLILETKQPGYSPKWVKGMG